MTLCHNETLDWVDSATDVPRHNGLTKFGEAVVLELNRLGILVDLAHTSPRVMHRVLDISRAPVLFSHNNATTLCDHPRNAPDDVLDRIRAKKSVIMATFIPDFINQKARDWSRPLRDNYGKSSFLEITKSVWPLISLLPGRNQKPPLVSSAIILNISQAAQG